VRSHSVDLTNASEEILHGPLTVVQEREHRRDRTRHSLVTAAMPQRILLDSGTHSGLIQSAAGPLNSNKSVK
jgi:hypothetical protein